MSALPLHLLSDNARVEADGSLSVGGCRVDEIAAEFGTPVFLYDEAHLRARRQAAVAAFGHQKVVSATKALLWKAMATPAYH